MPRTPRLVSFALLVAVCGALLLASAAPAAAAEKYTRGLRYPSLTPDGKQVVFAYRGDIWITDVDGKAPARRLTIHEAQDTLPRVSPDGKTIAFSSTRDGGFDIYLMPLSGGEAKRLTWHSDMEIVCDWSPDGKKLLFASSRDPSLYRIDLYEIPIKGGGTRRITRDGGRDGSYSSDGKTVVYARGFNTIYQDDYEGSANYDLYTIPVAGGLPTRLLKSKGSERFPVFSKDGKRIYFVAEEKKVANFYAIAASSRAPTTGPAVGGQRTQITKFKGNDVQRPCLAWDRTTVVYERWGQLYISDLSAAKPKDKQLPLLVKGDRRHSGVSTRTVTNGASQVDVSQDGSGIVFSMHGEIWATSGSGGNAKRLTSGSSTDEWPRLSPDGNRIAFQSKRSGNSDIFLMNSRGGSITQLTKNSKDDFFHSWSPDGKKLVFSSDRSGNRDIWIIDTESRELKQLTTHRGADDDPVWSPDGKTIAFDSSREGSQAIYVMDTNGKNVRRVTNGTGFLQVPNFSPDGSLLTYEVFSQTTGRSGGIFVIGVNGGATMRISRDGQAACWSPRGDYIYFSVGPRGREEIFRVQAPKSVENREKVPFMGTIQVELRKELGTLFDEAWLKMGEGFYDPKMHGVDWKKMRVKYRDMAIDAENKSVFQGIIRQMLAELNASHLGIFGGTRPSNAVRAKIVQTGYLGLDLADGPGKDGGRRVSSVFAKGPADLAGIRAGDELVVLNGKKIGPDTDIDRILNGTVGKEVHVGFRPITEDGLGDRRMVTIKPITSRQLRAMTFVSWVAGCGKTVAKATKKKVGYIHLSSMNQTNLAKFQRAVASWNQRKSIRGMIIDVRENGGGNIHQQLMQILTARPFAYVKVRNSPTKMYQPALYWDKPVVLLINERSFSDAEVFPYIFKKIGVGKVIGVPTPGGVIGTNDITLSDGSTFRIPRSGYYGMDGTNLEHLGVQPDIIVEMTPEDRIEGRDPQLSKAITVVLEEIKARRASKKPTGKKPTKAEPKKTPEPTQPGPVAPKTPNAAKTTDANTTGANITGSALDPLADAKVGEWVRFKAELPGGQEATILKVRIVEISDGTVHFEREEEAGPPLPLPLPDAAPQIPLLAGLNTLGKVINQETILQDVKGERVEVVIVTLEAFGGQLRMHFSNAVPCLGLMKVEMGGTVVMEAIEWGLDSAEEATPEQPAPDQPAPEEPTSKKQAAKEQAAEGQPAAAKQAEASGPLDPLYDAKVGEWIRLRSVVQGEETVATLRVLEVTEDEIKLESRVAYGGEEIRGAVITRARQQHLAAGGRGKVEVGSDSIEVKGRKLECVTVTRTSRRGRVSKLWFCAEIPVSGLVRMERGGKVVRELLDWGTGEPPALPAGN